MKLRFLLLLSPCLVVSGCRHQAGEHPNTRLRKAIAAHDVEAVREALQAGAQVNTPEDNDGCATLSLLPGTQPTPLFAAVVHQQPKIVQVLLEAGADPNLIPLKGVSPLHLAVESADISITRLLLEHKANPNLRAKIPGYNPTPLIWAGGAKARPEQVELLLKAGANPNAIDAANECAMNYVGTPPTQSKTWRLLLKAGGKPRKVAILSKPILKKN